ncbi:Uncharacterised protein [Niallia circulans]|nr:Uncharacterised protein [Niallia circulans]
MNQIGMKLQTNFIDCLQFFEVEKVIEKYHL